MTGYSMHGRYFEISGNVMDGKTISMAFPFNDRKGFVPAKRLKVDHHTGNWGNELVIEKVTPEAIYAQVGSFSPFAILEPQKQSAVAYVDGAMVYEGETDAVSIVDYSVTIYNPLQGQAFQPKAVLNFTDGTSFEVPMRIIDGQEALPDDHEKLIVSGSWWISGGKTVENVTFYSYERQYQFEINKTLGVGERLVMEGFWIDDTSPEKWYFVNNIEPYNKGMSPAYHNIITPEGHEGRINKALSGSAEPRYYYVTDHLGSTRATIDDEGERIELTMFASYGKYENLEPLPGSVEEAREKFTGKEFDEEGEEIANGVSGIQAYYFGARFYDPEVGIWLSTDPQNQFFTPYGYATNPIFYIDENGESFTAFFIAACIGGVIGGGVSGGVYAATAGENFTAKGFWSAVGLGAVGGAITGGFGSLGSTAIGSALYASLGNTISYGATSLFTGSEITGGGIIAAGLTGLAGGLAGAGTERLLGGALNMHPVANAFSEIGLRGTSGFLIDAMGQSIANDGKVDWKQSVISGGIAAGGATAKVLVQGAIANRKWFYEQLTETERSRLNTKLSDYSGKNIDISKKYVPIRYGGLMTRLKFGSGAAGYTVRGGFIKDRGLKVYMRNLGQQVRTRGNLNTFIEELYHYFVGPEEYRSGRFPGGRNFPGEIFEYNY
ncbi:MAG: hypothetical protein GF401_00440 [Chitinivibrionales bacterium]|nr:hypothetical protein [Chitinivibrionales bacterium]